MTKCLLMTSMLLAVGTGLLFAADEEGSFDRTLTVSGAVDLDAMTDAGGITVKTGHSGSVHIHGVLKAEHGWFSSSDVGSRIRELERNPPIQQTGSQVRVGYAGHNLLKNISLRLEIETPADTQVHARADSGGIRVSGVRGRVDCKTDSGGIDVDNAGSDVRAEADSGGIHVRDITGSVFARADSGGIEANNVGGALDVQADSGHIQLSQTKAAPIRARADSGGVSVTLAHGAGYDVSAQSESGGVSVPSDTVCSTSSRQHVEGKIRGGGPMVSIRVDSGGIAIE